MGVIRWIYQEGAGLWWECRYIMIGETIANIGLNICLCRIWGVTGIVLATVLSVFVTNFFFCPEQLFRFYFKNGKLKKYWMDHAGYALTMIVSAIVSWFVCSSLLPMGMALDGGLIKGLICFAGRLIICSVISVGIYWCVWHRTERYNRAVRWLGRLKNTSFM